MDRAFDAQMHDPFDERVQLALKILASFYSRQKCTTVSPNEIRALKSYLGAEDWSSAPLEQVALAVIQRELNRVQNKSVRRKRHAR